MEQELKNSVLKSGTTIIGVVCKDGIVLGADRQTTAGNIVMSKNTQKAVQINDYLVLAGTGIASDIEMQKKILAAELRLKQLKSKKRPTVREAANLTAMMSYRGIRQFSAIPSIVGTLIAGINEDSTTELYSIEPAGTVIKVEDYDANLGSGMPFVLGFLEREYSEDLDTRKGVEKVFEALKSSTQRDIGSGYGIDIWTIKKEGIKHEIEQEISAEFKDRKGNKR